MRNTRARIPTSAPSFPSPESPATHTFYSSLALPSVSLADSRLSACYTPSLGILFPEISAWLLPS